MPDTDAEAYLELARHHLDAEHAGEQMAAAIRAMGLGPGPAWHPNDPPEWRREMWQFDGNVIGPLRSALAAWEAHQWPPDKRTGP